jgi:hypothetical protein
LCNREGDKVTVGEVFSTTARVLKTLLVPDPGQCVGGGASALGCPVEIVAALPLPTKAVKLGKLPDLVHAANGGDDLTRVGRWMSDDELAKMQKTGLVQEGSGGRTFVTSPADPAAFPAGKGVFAEFNVPTSSLFPAGKPEWAVIPGPNVGTTRFGPPPSQMPPATCIVVVCRR